MLKTTADKPATFGTLSKAMITYAVLSEYLRHPLAFLVRSALTRGRFKRTIPANVPRDFIDLFAFPA